MRFLATIWLVTGIAIYAQDAPKQDAPKQDAAKQDAPKQDAPKQDAAKKGGRGMPHKNLQILPDKDIGPIMGSYTAALGIERNCLFCHVQGDFAADTNPKKDLARKMIKMVNDNNAIFADGKIHVTCYTCHRGKTVPETVPPAAAPAGQ